MTTPRCRLCGGCGCRATRARLGVAIEEEAVEQVGHTPVVPEDFLDAVVNLHRRWLLASRPSVLIANAPRRRVGWARSSMPDSFGCGDPSAGACLWLQRRGRSVLGQGFLDALQRLNRFDESARCGSYSSRSSP